MIVMARRRSEADQQVAELLRTAKSSPAPVASRSCPGWTATTQHLEVVESSVPFLFKEGATQRQETTFCQAILDGKLPAVMPDVRAFPAAMRLPAARLPRIRSYVSVPVVLSDGTLYGTFCAAGLTSDKELTKRDKALMDVLAHAAAVVIEPGVRERGRRDEIEERLLPVHRGGRTGRRPAADRRPGHRRPGRRRGAEPVPGRVGQAPDVVLRRGAQRRLGDRLELLALERAAEHLDQVAGYVAMNVSPGHPADAASARELLGRLPLDRVAARALRARPGRGLRRAARRARTAARPRGMRLAIDDVGAGFSSLRHIVLTAPDVIKLDRSLVDGVDGDPVLRTLVRSLVDFAHGCDATVVAEGVETAADAAALLALGVDHGQGWHFGRPGPAADLADCPPRATRSASSRRAAAATG